MQDDTDLVGTHSKFFSHHRFHQRSQVLSNAANYWQEGQTRIRAEEAITDTLAADGLAKILWEKHLVQQGDKGKVGAVWGFIPIASRPSVMDVGGFSNANTAEHVGGMTTSARYKN